MKFLGVFAAGVLVLLASPRAMALQSFNPSDYSSLTDADVKALIQTVAIGAGHRAYAPASRLGITGIDLGIDVTAIQLPTAFRTALSNAGVGSVPLWIAIPRINVRKGLPGGVDLGVSYIGYQGNQLYGGDVQWNFLKAQAGVPAFAVRASESYLKVFFMQTHSFKTDLIVSKPVTPLLEPYGGAGMEFMSGDLNVPLSGPQGLSANISGHQSGSAPHVFVGMPIKLLLLHATAEIDHSFAQGGLTTYGAKITLSF